MIRSAYNARKTPHGVVKVDLIRKNAGRGFKATSFSYL